VLATVLGTFLASRTNRPRKTLEPKRPQVRTDYFSIRQTRSDLGYVYWVLQGHGRFASFALFDSWREAMDAAHQHISEAAPDSQSVLLHAR
jgi:hypothetical protein